LRGEIADRRLANLDARFRPSLDLQGNAAYHSEVPSIPGGLFAGPPRDQYSLVVGADQRLWDAGRTEAEKGIEQAARDADRQQVEVDFYNLRERLEGAFFAALGTQAELDLLATLESDLSAQLRRVESRVSAGTALPGDAAVLAATREEERQRVLQVAGERRAAFAVLQALTGLPLDEGSALATPEPEAPTDPMDAARAAARGRGRTPRLEALARPGVPSGESLDGLARKPVVSAAAQGGPAARPNPSSATHPFAVVGVARWQPFGWGNSAREAEIKDPNRVRGRERAFLETLRRACEPGLADRSAGRDPGRRRPRGRAAPGDEPQGRGAATRGSHHPDRLFDERNADTAPA
jgi:hypothetical protein